MTPLQAIILAVTEGLTEFLPISSTGHMVLVSAVLKIPQTEFTKSFEIFIQLGAILAVGATFWRMFLPAKIKIWLTVFVAFIPTGIIGFISYKFVKNILLGNLLVTLLSLFVGGIALILIEAWHKDKKRDELTRISPAKAVLVGLFQSLAIIPGISRSAASISGGLILGLPRITAVEFSFLLAIPTILAATVLDLYKSQHNFSFNEYKILLLGFVFAFVTALVTVKFFLQFVRDKSLTVFGNYRVFLAVVLGLFFLVFNSF